MKQTILKNRLIHFIAQSFMCFSLFFYFNYIDLNPLSDDLSMIAFSKAFSTDWFKKGLSDYFIVYPEFYGPQSNFIRPVSNFMYWIFSNLIPADDPFLPNKIQLIVLTYGTLIGIAFCVYSLSSKISGSWTIAILGFLSCILIPTFWTTPSPTYTSFAFDGLSILFCLGALIAFDRKRILMMTICMTLALLTKEIAAPVMIGFLLVFALRRHSGAILACSTAFAVFVIFRLIGFGLHADGVYVFNGADNSIYEFVMEKLRNISSLPFGPVVLDDIFAKENIALMNRSGILLLINLSLYGALFFAVLTHLQIKFRPISSTRQSEHSKSSNHDIVTQLALSASGIAFLFDSYVGANYRYAFNLLPFLFVATAGLQIGLLRKKIVFVIFLTGSVFASTPFIVRLYTNFDFEIFRYQKVRSLFDVLRAQDNPHSIAILNDFVLGYANPDSLNILIPTERKIFRGTSIYLDSCSLQSMNEIKTNISRVPNEFQVNVTLPSCARFIFESAPNLSKFVSGNRISRNDKIFYEFEYNAESRYADIHGWSGRDLTIVLRDTDIVYFDFEKSEWIYLDHLK